MSSNSFLRKIWTISPQGLYVVINKYLRRSKNIDEGKDRIITVQSGYAEGVKLRVKEEIPQEYQSMVTGEYEDVILKSLMAYLSIEGKVVWDVGAHIGFQSLAFAKNVGSMGKVISFEPNPNNIKSLNDNFQLNKTLALNITLVQLALSDRIGSLNFRISKYKNRPETSGGYLTTVVPPLPDTVYKDFINISVSVSTINELLINEKLPIPDIIKIDVEGAELSVLKGGEAFLRKSKPVIIIEVHTIQMMFEIQAMLLEIGYSLRIVDNENPLPTRILLATPI